MLCCGDGPREREWPSLRSSEHGSAWGRDTQKIDHDEAGIVGVVRLDDVNDSATGAVDKRSLSPEVVSQYDFGADHDDTRATCLS